MLLYAKYEDRITFLSISRSASADETQLKSLQFFFLILLRLSVVKQTFIYLTGVLCCTQEYL